MYVIYICLNRQSEIAGCRSAAHRVGFYLPREATVRDSSVMLKKGRPFPREFLWGSATAAQQVDGGDEASDWAEFARVPGKIKDGSSPLTACDHWNRYESDFQLMAKLKHNAYRLGVDWSRFQPRPDAPFSRENLDHFRKMLGSLKKKKIRPLLTLNHFAVPAWWLSRGGWEKEENIQDFLKFVEFIVSGVGDLVQEYITFNEPNVYQLQSYLLGEWPPGESGIMGFLKSLKVQRNMIIAHFKMVDMIREIHGRKWKKPAQIGVAMHNRVMDPADPESGLDRDRALEADRRFNWIWADCVHSGRLQSPLGNGEKLGPEKAWDFYGVNYYSRNFMKFDWTKPHMLFIGEIQKENLPRNELGWEIYPEGMTRILLEIHQRYGLPIRVTENGIPTSDEALRTRFLEDHVRAMADAMSRGVDVRGYYHWSFMDNFEWAEGYVPRFGLLRVDYGAQKRTIGPAAKAYTRIISSGKI